MNSANHTPSMSQPAYSPLLFSWFYYRIFMGAVLAAILLLTTSLTWAHSNNNVALATERAAKAEQLTQQLVGLSRVTTKAPSTDQNIRLQTLMTLADERQQLLLDMVQDNPGEVLRVALPNHIRTIVPDTVKTMLESHADQAGTVEVICIHDEHGSPTKYFLKTATERLSLHFKKNPPDLLTGATVKVSGLTLKGKRHSPLGETEGAMAVDSGNQDILILAAGNGNEATQGTAEATGSAPLPNTIGEQRTAVILYQYADSPETPPQTAQEMYDYVFGEQEGTVNQFFKEQSYNKTWLAGDVYGWYRLSVTGEEACAGANSTALAKTQAALDGFVEDHYDRIVNVSSNRPCSTSIGGGAEVGGKNSWVTGIYPNTGQYEMYYFAHEIGHTLGLYHAHAWDCVTTTLGENCLNREYGDKFDTMSSGIDLGHFNLFHKELLGWVNGSELLSVTQNGQFTIDTYEPVAAGLRGIKIPKGVNPSTGQPSWYYLEHRQPILIDEFFQDFSYLYGRGDVTDGILIHKGEPTDHNSSFLLHTNPDNSEMFDLTGIPDWWDPGLHTGQTYEDTEAGVNITVLSSDESHATVDVTITGPACRHVNPAIDVAPNELQWVPPGTTVTYTVTITNQDSSNCQESPFSIATTAPVGWETAVTNPVLVLASGQTNSTTLEVTSSTSANNGFYDLTFSANNQNESGIGSSVIRTYVVDQNGVNDPPLAMDDQAMTRPGIPVTIDVLANDFDPEGLALSVLNASHGTQGTVTLNSDFTVTYSPSSKTKPRDSFTYTISDGVHEANGAVTIKFEKGDGGGKGGGKPNK